MKRLKMLYLAVYDMRAPIIGPAVRGEKFVNYFAKHYDVHLVFMEGVGHAPDPNLTAEYQDSLKGILSMQIVPFNQLGYFTFSPALFKAAAQRIRSEQPDLIFADYGLAATYAIILSRQFGTPFVYSSCNLEYATYISFGPKDKRRYLLAPYVYLAERLAVSKARLVVAISHLDAKAYAKWTDAEKILVIPQGFDSDLYNPHYELKPNIRPVVLFYGNYKHTANREGVYLIAEQILPEVVAQNDQVIFRFIGANFPDDVCHPNIESVGFVDNLADHIKQANIVLCPVLRGGSIRTKIIEALACGKQIITTPNGLGAVDPHFAGLTVCEINQFADSIINILQKDSIIYQTDYESVYQEYAWNSLLMRLDHCVRQAMTQ